MKKLLLLALLGLALPLVPDALPGANHAQAQETVQRAHRWKLAGKYRTYKQACDKADELEDRGYDTRIKRQGGSYCVYCKKRGGR